MLSCLCLWFDLCDWSCNRLSTERGRGSIFWSCYRDKDTFHGVYDIGMEVMDVTISIFKWLVSRTLPLPLHKVDLHAFTIKERVYIATLLFSGYIVLCLYSPEF